jgi:hypothetical protein
MYGSKAVVTRLKTDPQVQEKAHGMDGRPTGHHRSALGIIGNSPLFRVCGFRSKSCSIKNSSEIGYLKISSFGINYFINICHLGIR